MTAHDRPPINTEVLDRVIRRFPRLIDYAQRQGAYSSDVRHFVERRLEWIVEEYRKKLTVDLLNRPDQSTNKRRDWI